MTNDDKRSMGSHPRTRTYHQGPPMMEVTGFWMRNDVKGDIEVLVQYKGKWVVVFAKTGPAPVACDDDQMIDHMIHAGGVQNLIDHGSIHGAIRGRKIGKPDRHGRLKAKLAARKR